MMVVYLVKRGGWGREEKSCVRELLCVCVCVCVCVVACESSKITDEETLHSRRAGKARKKGKTSKKKKRVGGGKGGGREVGRECFYIASG